MHVIGFDSILSEAVEYKAEGDQWQECHTSCDKIFFFVTGSLKDILSLVNNTHYQEISSDDLETSAAHRNSIIRTSVE